MDLYRQALDVALQAARDAGQLLRDEFHRPGGPRGAGEHADIDDAVEQHIRQKLLAAIPWDYLGEETGFAKGDGSHLWLVDPNDGTAAYLQGWRGSAVSIAALREGVPILGVVYAFAYPDEEGDLIAWAEGCGPMTRNGRPIERNLRGTGLGPKTVVILSQSADHNPAANAACVQPSRYLALPSTAYRVARAAVGDGVAAVSLNSPCSWDYAAGHALLRAAGQVLVDEKGAAVTYTAEGRSSVRWCFSGAPEVVEQLRSRNWSECLAPVRQSPFPPPFCLVRPTPGQSIADQGMLQRAQGCLLGQLIGDSLGGLVEFRSVESIAAQYPQRIRDLADGGCWRLLAGQPTDDSELALMLARTLAHQGAYDRGAILDAYVHWYQDPGTFDVGGTIRRALAAASRRLDLKERLQMIEEFADASRPSNGSLMRISPLGIFTAAKPGRASELARLESKLTHPSPVCQDACAIYVTALATAMAQGGGPEACYAAALAEANQPDIQPEVREAVANARHGPPKDYVTLMGWVLIALRNAFYQLLHAPNLEEGLVDTVMHGGDTDTNAAIAGALLGAVHGRKAIPWRWLQRVLSCRPLRGTGTAHPRGVEYWPVDALQLAEALLVAGHNAAR
jgi:ADP-ribosylglycohydrolase/fructose-1,6-bisphosphatase/inositol monophosphatase family enzyme